MKSARSRDRAGVTQKFKSKRARREMFCVNLLMVKLRFLSPSTITGQSKITVLRNKAERGGDTEVRGFSQN